MKCINRMRTQSKTIVLIMMALKDMRGTSNCDNKRNNEKKCPITKAYDENNHAERQYFNKPSD